jgi:hypothetical protein
MADPSVVLATAQESVALAQESGRRPRSVPAIVRAEAMLQNRSLGQPARFTTLTIRAAYQQRQQARLWAYQSTVSATLGRKKLFSLLIRFKMSNIGRLTL